MSPPQNRVVVIGAGIGGLTAAIRLAGAGCDITLVEAHTHPGGKMRTVPSDAGLIDAGPTVMTMRPIFEALFESIGERLADHVTLHREPLLARHWWPDGSALDLFDDSKASQAAVRDFAGPKAEAEFCRFCEKTQILYTAFDALMMKTASPSILVLAAHVLQRPWLIQRMAPLRTLAQSLRTDFSDTRLRQLFGRYATYVGGSPYQSPALLSLIWHSEAQGIWRVEGGMHRLAEAMLALAQNLGAAVIFGQSATRIEQQSGRITAVQLSDGTRLPCDSVVFNGDPKALCAGALGVTAKTAIARQAAYPRSLSAFVWSFAAEPAGVPLAHHNIFFGQDPRTEFDPISQGRMPEDPTFYVCAQDRGGNILSEGIERFEIIMNAPAGIQPQPEEAATCQTRTFETLRQRGLSFSPKPEMNALTTPTAFNQLFPHSDGALYGRSPHGMMAAFQRPTVQSRVPGLFLAGGGVHPGAGIPMACLSGQHAAAAILSGHASTSRCRQTVTPGGILTASATMASVRSRSSAS
ncbi:MAG: phytoene desaturase [Rhodobacteraceae bacterium]|nr:phytoene desaturase [Paracoccaceae bacterium]